MYALAQVDQLTLEVNVKLVPLHSLLLTINVNAQLETKNTTINVLNVQVTRKLLEVYVLAQVDQLTLEANVKFAKLLSLFQETHVFAQKEWLNLKEAVFNQFLAPEILSQPLMDNAQKVKPYPKSQDAAVLKDIILDHLEKFVWSKNQLATVMLGLSPQLEKNMVSLFLGVIPIVMHLIHILLDFTLLVQDISISHIQTAQQFSLIS